MSVDQFLGALFDGLDGEIELRPIREGGGVVADARRWYADAGELAAGVAEIAAWGLQTRTAIYFGVLPRQHGRGDKAGVLAGHVVWVDLDFKDFADGEAAARGRLDAFEVQPSIRVASGHGLHAYWLLDGRIAPPALEELSQRLALALGGDHCFDAARVLRLPGTWNCKGEAVAVEIEHLNTRRIDPLTLAALLPEVEAQGHTGAAEWDWTIAGVAPPALATWRQRDARLDGLYRGEGKAEGDGTGSGYDYSFVMALIARGMDEGDDLVACLAARIRDGGREKRDDYIQRTVGRALAQAGRDGVTAPGDGGVARSAGSAQGEAGRTDGGDGGAAPRRRGPPEGVEAAVWDELDVNRQGRARGSIRNVTSILRLDSRWARRIWRNDFDGRSYLDDTPITDEAEVGIAIWLDEHYEIAASTSRVHEVAAYLAAQQARHPVREYLADLEWDQQARCRSLFSTYFGAEDTDLNGELSVCFLVSLVARVLMPGCKVDTVPILVGGQGVGKSTGLETLMPKRAWFSDSQIDVGRKDAFAQLRGVWLYELGELAGVRRSQVEMVKAFVTSKVDRYRPAYGRNIIEQPRQVVFAGSTNEQEFLSDSSGSRRWWPVQTGEVDTAAILRDRHQLWAEAVVWFKTQGRWWLAKEHSDALVEASEPFQQGDPWGPTVQAWLEQRVAPFLAADVLIGPIEKDRDKLTRGDQMRVGALLKSLGCTKQRRRVGGIRCWWWTAPGAEDYDE